MKRILSFVIMGILIISALSSCGLLTEPEVASGPIEAIPLEIESSAETTPESTEEVMEPVSDETDESIADEPVAEATAIATEESAEVETTEATTEDQSAETTTSIAPTVYAIVPGESTVRFELDEDLRGSRITVVGETDQVAGEMAFDLSNLADTQIGTIQINARTLSTDNNFRNRAIQNDILRTGAFEFITFTPTAINDLPESATVGDTVTFSIDGDLTIRDTTLPATFDITATVVSAEQIDGSASTVINREAFDLSIPSVPNVANVEEEVELYIDFVARAKSE